MGGSAAAASAVATMCGKARRIDVSEHLGIAFGAPYRRVGGIDGFKRELVSRLRRS
jgi:hypothetical protein